MSRKIKIFTTVISIFLTVQLVSAQDTPTLADTLVSNKLSNTLAVKETKLMGDLPKLRDNWVISQSNPSVSFVNSNPLLNIIDNNVVVDAVATDDVQALAQQLRELGMRKISIYGRVVSGQFPVSKLNDVSSVDELRFVRPAYATTNVGNVTSQGDVAMNTVDVRSTYMVDGTGITIGTLSDSYNCLGGAPGDVTSGDLPSGVNVISDFTSATCSDEGRAMMQLIHDVAPGASQAFHTAFNGMADFAQGIQDLANAGADVIVDDVFYFAEPFFQDGIIAQSVDTVVASGVTYFSSAGNSARKSYEGSYVQSNTGIPAIPTLITLHDFDPGAGVDNIQQITVPIGASVTISLQWNQPFFSVSGAPGASTNLDIAITDATGSAVLAVSANANIGGDPVEILQFTNNTGSSNLGLVIDNQGGPAPSVMKYIAYGSLTINEYNTASGTVVGHSNAAGAISVGAARYDQTPPYGTTPPVAEAFSSAGGIPILFNTSGNPVNINRNKPDIVAPDGTNTTFFGQDFEPDGWPNFFGTSAAAPHAAAAAVLMLDHNSSYTPATIVSLMESTAIDMDAAGFDFNTGHGLIDIQAALAGAVVTPPAATLVSPNGIITDNTPAYMWNAVSDSTWYYLWVDDSTGNVIKQWYTAAQAGCPTGTGYCSVTPTTTLAFGAASWWIQTYNSAGNGPWSAAMNFTVAGDPPPPIATLVSPNGSITDSTPTYTWNAVPDSTWYYLWVDDSTGNVIKQWYTASAAGCGSGTGTCSITPTTALSIGAGSWWVQTYNSAGYGPWSSPMNFNLQ